MFDHPHHPWLDAASFIALVAVVALAFVVMVWPQSTAQAADSFASMLKGVQLMLRGQ